MVSWQMLLNNYQIVHMSSEYASNANQCLCTEIVQRSNYSLLIKLYTLRKMGKCVIIYVYVYLLAILLLYSWGTLFRVRFQILQSTIMRNEWVICKEYIIALYKWL